jgi:ceramide glucosyltransferase
MDTWILIVGVALLAARAWQHRGVVRFFRDFEVPAPWRPEKLSVLAPVVGGDPHLADSLTANLSQPFEAPVEFLYLLDEDDHAGAAAVDEAERRAGGRAGVVVRRIVCPPPPDRCSPKMFKLVEGLPHCDGDVVVVLDDDTVLDGRDLPECLAHLGRKEVGLVFGLPYYASFDNLWSSLIAYFVNSHALLTYLPYVRRAEPVTINGMFYALRREALDAMGGFRGLEPILADDFAIARRVKDSGYRLAQSRLRHAIRTHVRSFREYRRLLGRWMTFPRETVVGALHGWERALVVAFGLIPVLVPVLFLALAIAVPGPLTASLLAACLLQHWLAFVHLDRAYLRGGSPLGRSWMVPLIQLLLPLHVVAGLFGRNQVDWRGNIIQVEPGGEFHYLERRGAAPVAGEASGS